MLDVAMVGLGSWARRMVDSVHGTSESIRFASAYSRTPAKIDPYCGERGIRTSDDLAAVVGDPDIGGVVVCSAAGVHAAHAMAALKAGKHMLVIKPLALNRADAEELSREAGERGLVLAMGYDCCFLPAVDELRRRVAAGDLGRILHAEGNFCVNRYANMKPGHWKSDATQIPPAVSPITCSTP